MRLASAAVLLASSSMVAADFLVRMHTQLITEPLLDDMMQVKVVSYENDKAVVVCQFGGKEYFSDNLDQFCADGVDGVKDGFGCREGWAACTWENGRQGHVAYHGNGVQTWEMKMVQGGGPYTYDCAPCVDGKCLKCSDWEHCLDNGNAGDAPKEDCPLCEHRGNYVCLDGEEL